MLPIELVKDLSKFSENIRKQLEGDKDKYVCNTLVANKGKEGCLYQINTMDGSSYTYCACQLRTGRYLHYLLTEDGVDFIKQSVVIASL